MGNLNISDCLSTQSAPKPKNADQIKPKPITKRIALLTDGDDTALEYALDACQRQDARLDLLLNNIPTVNHQFLEKLLLKIKSSGIVFKKFNLSKNNFNDLLCYLDNAYPLLYLVTTTTDSLSSKLLEQNALFPQKQLNIPLVLVNKSYNAPKLLIQRHLPKLQ